MGELRQGYVQVYTGNGKGKTTAALGLAVRAAGRGLKTFIVQFMKDMPYGEIRGLEALSAWIHLERYGNDGFVFRRQPPGEQDIRAARQALDRARAAMLSAEYDIVIVDELCVAIHFALLKTEDALSLVREKPEPIELIFTGRYCPPELLEEADLVTEMQEVKHYYQKGVAARKGIES